MQRRLNRWAEPCSHSTTPMSRNCPGWSRNGCSTSSNTPSWRDESEMSTPSCWRSIRMPLRQPEFPLVPRSLPALRVCRPDRGRTIGARARLCAETLSRAVRAHGPRRTRAGGLRSQCETSESGIGGLPHRGGICRGRQGRGRPPQQDGPIPFAHAGQANSLHDPRFCDRLYTSILKPRSTSEAGTPPRMPQFSGGISCSEILISCGGTSSAPRLRTMAW